MKREPKVFDKLRKIMIKNKKIIFMLLLFDALILGILLGIGLYNAVTEHQVAPMKLVTVEDVGIDKMIRNYRLPIDKSMKHEEVDIGQESIGIKQWEELEEMLVALQREYIHMYRGREADNMGDENKRYIMIKDLEEVHFYQDENGVIYFIPTSMVNKKITVENKEFYIHTVDFNEKENFHFYGCDFYKAVWRRVIYPEPYDKAVTIWSEYLEEIPENWHFLGTVTIPLPTNIPDFDENYDSKLYENEYTDAIKEILHSLMHRREEYGEYRIYIGDYKVNWNSTYSELGYNIRITATVVPVGGKVEEGSWWLFLAKDILDEKGKVIIETAGMGLHEGNFLPPIPNIASQGTLMDEIVRAERLVISLTVNEEDEVKELGLASDEEGINVMHYYLK